MLTRWLTMIKRKWHKVAGALAVLLMFYVPVTRVVLAATSSASDVQPNGADSGRNNTLNGTGAGASGTGPTTPRNPSPKSTNQQTATGHHTGHPTLESKPSAM